MMFQRSLEDRKCTCEEEGQKQKHIMKRTKQQANKGKISKQKGDGGSEKIKGAE